MHLKNKSFLYVCLLILFFASCSKDEEIRQPQDIMGVWSPDQSSYLAFRNNNYLYNLKIEYQDGLTIGIWNQEVYYYEPGYNLVIYLTAEHQAFVYEIVSLDASKMTWCRVDEIEVEGLDNDSIGHVIGDIINKAQEGFHLDPELYQTFVRISEDDYLSIIDSLDVEY